MADSGSFAVVLSSLDSLRSPVLPQLLAKHDGIPFADAARRAVTSWGIILEQVSEEKARALALALVAGGVPAEALPHDRLVSPAAAEQASGAVFAPGLVRWSLKKAGEVRELLDGEIALLAAAVYRDETSRTVTVKEGPSMGQKFASMGIMMATGLPINIGGKEKEVTKVEKQTETLFYLEALARNPERRVRVAASSFNFSCLGPKMLHGAHPNFRALLQALRERAPAARLNLGASVMLAGQPVSTLAYGGPQDLEREERWLLSI